MDHQLAVLTMNVWGLPGIFAKQKKKRLNALANYLNDNNYDFVCLQELWCKADFNVLKFKCRRALPYAQYFHSGVFGSGLAIYSKWPIMKTYYNQWSLNGYVHMLHHGDWYGGKGVALAQIAYKDLVINVYNSHLIAKYSDNDCYLVHRIVQAFDTGLFVDLTSPSADLTIFCGDLNSTPNDLCFKLIKAIGHLEDSYYAKDTHNKERCGTYGCPSNTFSGIYSYLNNETCGDRIDYILYRTDRYYQAEAISYNLPMDFSIPGELFSYSDHEAVEAVIKLNKKSHFCDFPKTGYDTNLIKSALKKCLHGERELGLNRFRYVILSIMLLTMLMAFQYFYPSLTFYFYIFLIPTIIYNIFLFTIWYKLELNGITSAKIQMQILIQLNRDTIAFYRDVLNEENVEEIDAQSSSFSEEAAHRTESQTTTTTYATMKSMESLAAPKRSQSTTVMTLGYDRIATESSSVHHDGDENKKNL
uniref:sphingomyelin phosphodiesterase n=1 Tax=Panstrongylus megistus TaxID=65343 RepID=A0A069DZ32_9HEMI